MQQRSTPKPTSADAQPLDIAAIQAEFPDSTPEFQILCLKKRHNLAQAQDAWQDVQLRALRADAAAIKAKAAANAKLIEARNDEIEELEAAAGKPGLEAVSDRTSGGDGEGGSARERVDALVAAKIKLGKPAPEAYAMVMEDNPDLRDEFVAEHNEIHRPQRRGRRVT